MSVVMQISELIAPLGYYAQGIFEEGNDDQEAANGWKIAFLESIVSTGIVGEKAERFPQQTYTAINKDNQDRRQGQED